MLRVARLVVLVAVVTAACTPSGDDPSTTSEAESSTSTTVVLGGSTTTSSAPPPPDGFGGTVRIGMDTSIGTLNPFASNNFHGRMAGNAVWATVFDIDPDTWERVPDAVTGMPSQSGGIEVNDDGTMTVRYELRSDARWSDGLPISGADLAFTAEAMRDLAIAGGAGVDSVMATVTATDSVEQIAFITFAQPTLAFEDALWIVLPSHALEGVDLVNGTDGTDWPSGGPFIVEEFDPFTDLTLVRNPFYWKTDASGRALPFLDRLTFEETTQDGLQGQEPASPVPAFLANERDVIEVPNWQDDIDRVSQAQGAVLGEAASPIVEMLQFQFGDGREVVNEASLNDELGYRQAVAHAIDRPTLLSGTDVPWSGQTPGMLLAIGTSAWEQYAYDPDAGTALVQDASGDFATTNAVLSTTGNGDYRIRIGDALEASFADIGVMYEPLFMDSVLFFGDALTEGAFDIGMWAWASDGGFRSQLQLLDVFDPRAMPPDGNYGRWGASGLSADAERFGELVDAAHATTDADEFETLVAEAEQILADLAITIPLFSRASRVAHWADVVRGVTANGSQSTFTWNVEEWQRVGE